MTVSSKGTTARPHCPRSHAHVHFPRESHCGSYSPSPTSPRPPPPSAYIISHFFFYDIQILKPTRNEHICIDVDGPTNMISLRGTISMVVCSKEPISKCSLLVPTSKAYLRLLNPILPSAHFPLILF